LAAPALSLALRACDAIGSGFAQRSGRVLTIANVGARVGRALLPAVGARAPAAAAVRFGELSQELDELRVALDATFAPPALEAESARALGLAKLTREADDALAASELDLAREKL